MNESGHKSKPAVYRHIHELITENKIETLEKYRAKKSKIFNSTHARNLKHAMTSVPGNIPMTPKGDLILGVMNALRKCKSVAKKKALNNTRRKGKNTNVLPEPVWARIPPMAGIQTMARIHKNIAQRNGKKSKNAMMQSVFVPARMAPTTYAWKRKYADTKERNDTQKREIYQLKHKLIKLRDIDKLKLDAIRDDCRLIVSNYQKLLHEQHKICDEYNQLNKELGTLNKTQTREWEQQLNLLKGTVIDILNKPTII